MDTKIFSMALSQDAISLYMILAALDMEEIPMEPGLYSKRWNGNAAVLSSAIEELQVHRVIDSLDGTLILRPSLDWC